MRPDTTGVESVDMNRRDVLAGAGAGILSGLAGCLGGQDDESEPTEPPEEADGMDEGTPTEEASLMDLAREEGQVRMIQGMTGVEPLFEAFSQDTGIEYEYLRMTTDNQIARIQTEMEANRLNFDVSGVWYPLTLAGWIDDEVFEEIPEGVTDGLNVEVDSSGTVGFSNVQTGLTLLYNTELVDDPPVTAQQLVSGDWEDDFYLDPRDEQILFYARDIMGNDAEEWVRKLGEQATLLDSHFTSAQNIASGEKAMAITFKKFQYYDFAQGILDETAPANFPIIGNPDYWGVLNGAPRPHAGGAMLRYYFENSVEYWSDQFEPGLIAAPDEVPDEVVYKTVDEVREEGIDPAALRSDWESLLGIN